MSGQHVATEPFDASHEMYEVGVTLEVWDQTIPETFMGVRSCV